MKAASVNILKVELEQIPTKQLVSICLRLARFKKENKELLTFLLFEADDIPGYIENVKKELDELFAGMNTSNLYFCKKSLRKILRIINKYIKYSLSKIAEAELLLYYLKKIQESGIPVKNNNALNNLYNNQLKKVKGVILFLHEDLQYDYLKQLDSLD
jgi:hypothetical protein